ncbi:MAG: SAM-dependent chlorinase/fluorinase [Candidatus Peribacteraceae bacterium]|nr:SAM-dependent chlorinase/fluorinase [Candidatus Peribacteraceae bacterium]
MHSIITITTDFGPGNKGIGVMHAVIQRICPDVHVINLAQDVPGFDVRAGARLLEAIAFVPAAAHICVVDPGVGTKRRALILITKRGDALVGPDNGVLIPATNSLGGIVKAFEVTNPTWMLQPVSAIFHGRDVFAPTAAHIAAGKNPADAGSAIDSKTLAPAPFPEAKYRHQAIEAEVIDMNSYGNVFLNIRAEEMHKLATIGNTIKLSAGANQILLPYLRTFGEVPVNSPVIIDDDFGRIEVAVNQGNFAEALGIDRGQEIILRVTLTGAD